MALRYAYGFGKLRLCKFLAQAKTFQHFAGALIIRHRRHNNCFLFFILNLNPAAKLFNECGYNGKAVIRQGDFCLYSGAVHFFLLSMGLCHGNRRIQMYRW